MTRIRLGLTSGVLLIAVSSCFGAVRLSVGRSAYIVASPKSQLDKRTVGQLSNYLSAVLRRETRVVADLRAVPPLTPAIVLTHAGEVNPLRGCRACGR